MRKEFYRAEFETEFQFAKMCNSQIPFSEVFDASPKFKEYLCDEYVESEPFPVYRLYRRKYIADEEYYPAIEKGGEEKKKMEARGWEIVNEWEGKKREEIPAEYCLPRITDTNIIRSLCEVKQILRIFEKSVFDSETDKYKEPKIRAEVLIQHLNKISQSDLRKSIIEYIVNENLNLTLVSDSILDREYNTNTATQDKWERWAVLKVEFDRLLTKELECNKDETGVDDASIDDLRRLYLPKKKDQSQYPNTLADLFDPNEKYEKIAEWLIIKGHMSADGAYLFDKSEFVPFVLTLYYRKWITIQPKAAWISRVMNSVGLGLTQQQVGNILRRNIGLDKTYHQKESNRNFFDMPDYI